MFRALDISTSGLVAQRQRMNTVAANIANAQTTRDENGEVSPYQRRVIHFRAAQPSEAAGNSYVPGHGVTGGDKVEFEVRVDETTPPRKAYMPNHPDADQDGYVKMPSIDLVTEFVNALEASRAYEANVTAMEISKSMAQMSMRIIA